MKPHNENMPVGENEDQFTEGSYQAIHKKSEGSEEDATEQSEQKKDTFQSITDIQNDTDPGSAEDVAREQGPYGVQE